MTSFCKTCAQPLRFLLSAPVRASQAPRQLCQEESLLSGWEERSLKGSLTSKRGSPPNMRGPEDTYYTDRCRQVPGQRVQDLPPSISTLMPITSAHTGTIRAGDMFGKLVRVADCWLKAHSRFVGNWCIHSVAVKDL